MCRITYCPLCHQPLSEAEITGSPEGEYPSHYACRVALQEAEEAEELTDQDREYRGQEEDAISDE